MRKINKIIIHHSATEDTMDIGVKTIREWHLARKWNDIGYHYVIRLDGTCEVGRPIDKIGAHCKGQNTGSIGLCCVGGLRGGVVTDTLNYKQLATLQVLVNGLCMIFNLTDRPIFVHKNFAKTECCKIDLKKL